ncbi:SDR family NAD(P)-dependent oxidoreductase [Pseudorhodoferax sp. LjRoot39]
MSAAPQVVLVTGAAGHLGQAVAAHFQQGGARLLLLDRDAQALQRLYGEMRGAQTIAADLLDRAQLQARIEAAWAAPQRIDVLCHLAGGFRMGEAVHELAAGSWDFLMDLNARSFLNVAAAVVPRLLAQGAGRVVTVGAGAAQRGGAHMGGYSASKSALMRLTESMSAELRDQGINVNCVLPSVIDTPDNRASMPDADASRWVTPAALADVVGFLASDAARAVHGAALPVSGRV